MVRDEELVAKRHVRHHLAVAAGDAQALTPGDEGRRSRPRIVAYSDSSGDEGGVRFFFFGGRVCVRGGARHQLAPRPPALGGKGEWGGVAWAGARRQGRGAARIVPSAASRH